MAMLALFLHLAVAVAAGESPSLKKGLCIPPGENFHCGDLEAFSRASWWYNWHTQSNHEKGPNYCTCSSECGPEPESPSFVPMVWGYHSNQSWHDDITDPVADKYPIILGFNEPDRGNRAFGADLSPEEAAAAWIELQVKCFPQFSILIHLGGHFSLKFITILLCLSHSLMEVEILFPSQAGTLSKVLTCSGALPWKKFWWAQLLLAGRPAGLTLFLRHVSDSVVE